MKKRDEVVRTPEELAEFAKSALAYPELVEVVRTDEGGVVRSPIRCFNLAVVLLRQKYPRMDSRDVQRLAQATRWLGKLRNNYPGKFEEIVSSTIGR